MLRLTRTLGAVAIAATMAFASHAMTTSAAGSTVVVTPAHTQGWYPATLLSGATYNYVYDPTSPLPTGALQLTTDGTTASHVQYLKNVSVPLNNVTELSYYTKQNSASSPGGDPSYQLVVDLTGNGDYTTFVYEPYWQVTQGPVVAGTWQFWNVASPTALLWSSSSFDNGSGCSVTAGHGGPPFYSLYEIQSMCPNAQVVSFGVNVGSYNTNYNVETDGVDFNGTVYNFEQTNEPTSKDQCKDGGWQNLTDANGNAFKNQGQCVSYSNHH